MTKEKKSSCGCMCGTEAGSCKSCGKIVSIIFVLALLAAGYFYFQEDVTLPAVEEISLTGPEVKAIEIVRADLQKFPLDVEVVKTIDEQRVGLQGRTSLPQGKGMLFVYDPPQEVRFWMKETLIPLDILFILPDGTIYKIVEGAKPHDETPIPSEAEVNAVLELAGGEVKRMGITVGDSLRLAQ